LNGKSHDEETDFDACAGERSNRRDGSRSVGVRASVFDVAEETEKHVIGKLILCVVVVIGMYFVYLTAVDQLHNIGDAALKSQRH
jgi:hypothetical protein